MKRNIIACVCLTLAACSAPYSNDESEARKQLLAIAPVGSDARRALPILENQGFDCKWSQQQGFAGLSGKHDYLYCDLEKTEGFLVSRRWQLALVHTNYIVTNAQFGIGLTGL